jgi:hypothetical protein
LLSEADLPLRVIDTQAFIDFLGPQDEPWLRVVLDELARFEGRRRRELAERLAEPLPCEAPLFKRRAATRVMLHLWRGERAAPIPPRTARACLFAAGAATEQPVAQTVASVAGQLGITEQALGESLFADLPGERLVRAPVPAPTASELALRTNLAIAAAVLMRASTIRVEVEGAVRPLVRLAKLRGLLCHVTVPPAEGVQASLFTGEALPVLEFSGPFSLFRHTLLYGRALGQLLPSLAWCHRFRLHAMCRLRGRLARVALATGDPIFPAAAPPTFDSRLEERFARDLGRLAPDWDLIREPEPIRAGPSLIFPDFLLRHRIHPERRVLIEIAGFWTPDYLRDKLARLRAARLPDFILCVDDERACVDDPRLEGMHVVRFRRRVDARAVMDEVLRLVEVRAAAGSPGWHPLLR